MPQIFVYCERNAKGATFTVPQGATVADLKQAINARQNKAKDEFNGTSLLLGGISKVMDHRMTFNGPEMTQTQDIATGRALGFQGCMLMVSQFLPGPINPGGEEKPMSLHFRGHQLTDDEKTLSDYHVGDGSTVKLDI